MRAKLIVVGVGSSIMALSIIAVLSFFIAKDAISDSVMIGLSAVSTHEQAQIEAMFDHYEDEVLAIAGDTQVRSTLRHLIATGDDTDRFVLNQILTDREHRGEEGEIYDLHDAEGNVLASSEPGHIGVVTFDASVEGFVVDVGQFESNDDNPPIRISVPIDFDGRTIGYATSYQRTDDLIEIVTDYLGRGDTGESLVIGRDSNGNLRYITTLRFNDGGDYYRTIDDSDINRIEYLASQGATGQGTDLVDYRGTKVFGQYTYIKTADISLIVKLDESEALSRLDGMRSSLFMAIVGVSIVIVIVAILIARNLINPIHKLTRAAELFSRGDLDSRVELESTDEIGILGETFNIMANSLQESNNDLESRVKERTVDLRRSNQDLEQFAYVASHDLQEPLRMVSSYTQLLSRRYSGKLDSDADEFIGFAVDGAKRMQSLINDLLLYSRAGRQDDAYETIDASDVVNEAVMNLGSRIDAAGATVNCDDLPSVVADRAQLISIFQNLISNSIKYRSPTRDALVEVSAQRTRSAWEFKVKDNGIGIDSAFSDRIFTIFQRLHARDEYQGTGIGLAVVKKIVERTGGTIRLESKLDEGSSFIFTVIDRTIEVDSSEEDGRNVKRAAS
jgi:signal transduction histidine kinase